MITEATSTHVRHAETDSRKLCQSQISASVDTFFGPALAFWIAARPGMLLCDYCYQAAQVLAGDIRCARRAGG